MKRLFVFLIFTICILSTGCDFIVYYSLSPSDTKKVTYNPVLASKSDSTNQLHGNDLPYEENVSWTDTGSQESLAEYNDDADNPLINESDPGEDQPGFITNRKFTLVILPDTQYYSRLYPYIFTAQTEWIAAQRDKLNIVYVLHEGDIVDQNTAKEWENARASMEVLDTIVPYAITVGNHDIGPEGLPSVNRDTSLFNTYFPLEKYAAMSSFGGTYEPGKLENCYHVFHASGIDWLILTLEFCPRDDVLKWANQIAGYFPDRRIILLTHSYLYFDGSLHGLRQNHRWTPYSLEIARQPGGVNTGADIWKKLIQFHPNFSLVFCGHILAKGTGYMESTTPRGNKVYQILANYQMKIKGGNGFLRIIEFDPDNKRIVVKTYSPYIKRYLTDRENQFVIRNADFF